MAANKRSKIQRDRDRQTISELLLKGWTHQRIADLLEVDRSMVTKDAKAIRAGWKAEALEDTDIYVRAELHRIAMLEAEYWDAWQRSQQDKQTTVQERLSSLIESDSSDGSGGRSKVLLRKEQRTGELAALNGIVKCIELRSKLLGLFPEASATAGGQVHLNENQLSVIASLMGEQHGAANS